MSCRQLNIQGYLESPQELVDGKSPPPISQIFFLKQPNLSHENGLKRPTSINKGWIIKTIHATLGAPLG